MKKLIMTLIAMLCITASTKAMSYEQARREAYFLTDKMAYELNLTPDQYDAAYEINLDYLMGVATVDDVYSDYWRRRNLDMSYILLQWQWDAFCAATYFYRPLYWSDGFWHFAIYARYPRRNYFYFSRPTIYISYRGGHSWRSNGGRSYYHAHRDHYHNSAHRGGMRDSWDRGDFRGKRAGGNSSTRVTVNNGNDNNRFGNSRRSGSFRGSRTNTTANRPSSNGTFRIGDNSSKSNTFNANKVSTGSSGFRRPDVTTTTRQPNSTMRTTTFGGARNSGSFSNTRRNNTSTTNTIRSNTPSSNFRSSRPSSSMQSGSFRSTRGNSGASTRSAGTRQGTTSSGNGFSGRR